MLRRHNGVLFVRNLSVSIALLFAVLMSGIANGQTDSIQSQTVVGDESTGVQTTEINEASVLPAAATEITAEPLAPTPGLALIIGVIGGLIVVLSIVMLDKMKIDDPVGAISAHGTCGIWGLLAVTLTGGSLGAQIYGALMIFLWTFIVSLIFWSIIKMLFGLRVTEEEESDGVDISECGLEAYPEFSKATGAKPSVYPEQ